MILRPYQADAEMQIRRLLAAGKRRVLTVAPTGSGKTVLATKIIRGAVAKNTRTWFLAHRKELIDQPSRKLDQLGVQHGVIQASHPRAMPWHQVQVCSVQTLVNRLDRLDPPGLIIVDEAHHARAATYERILSHYPDVPVIGLTATPWRTDGKGLGDLFEESVLVATPGQLVDEGWLSSVTGFAFDSPDLRSVRKTGADYNERELGVVMSETKLVGHMLEQWLAHCRPAAPFRSLRSCLDGRGVRTVVFAVHVEHSRQITAMFRQAGVAAEHVDGEMPLAEREAILRRLATGETRVVSNCNVLTEGFDEPGIGCVILARPTMSLALAIQMIGRGRRPVCYDCGEATSPLAATCPACGSVNVKRAMRLHDHGGVVLQHGLPDDDRDWSLTGSESSGKRGGGEKVASVRACKKCFALYAAELEACPACGYRNPQRVREIKTVDGVAVPLEQLKRPATASDERKREEYQRLVRLGHAKGYKPGWAKMRFKGRYGEWPRREWEPAGIGGAAGARGAA